MVTSTDPIAQRCVDLVLKAAERQSVPSFVVAGDFIGASASPVEMALRSLVADIDRAVRGVESHSFPADDFRFGRDEREMLLHFKVPNARDLVDEAFIAALRVPPSVDALGTFYDELAKRHIRISIAPLPTT
jgi:hypothetical protein